jgi:1-deoxy-D-xylulose-5-phosphate reductoisomerase
MNAANEVAVAAFLDGQLAFDRIPLLVEAVMQARPPHAVDGLAIILSEDAAARKLACEQLAALSP